ncbi:YpfB family protein [Bacillaceae bacterium Marseille-Q3522]|nr:YpfB family protein [Bacillaceae bacterium Marseille-Q3522]
MKKFERILCKIILAQFILLIVSQILLHQFNIFPELKQITQYEGVTNNSFTAILEAFNGKNKK